MNSFVSIYIPAFNAENTIRECLNSVLDQSLKPEEILVINDGSTDNTSKILMEFKNKISVINNPMNLGVSESMNIANKFLKTKFIGKIDADVELSKDWLKTLMRKMLDEKITLIGGKMYEKFLKNPNNLWRSRRLKQNWGEQDLENPKFIFGCNNILNNSNFKKLKKYRTDLDYFKTNGEDIEFSNYLKKNNYKLYYDSNAICYHLQNDTAETLSKRYWRYIHYGDGLKKRNFFKTLKNIFRQLKRTIKWSIEDLFKLDFNLLILNFKIFFYFSIIDYNFYKENFK